MPPLEKANFETLKIWTLILMSFINKIMQYNPKISICYLMVFIRYIKSQTLTNMVSLEKHVAVFRNISKFAKVTSFIDIVTQSSGLIIVYNNSFTSKWVASI